MSYFFCCLFTQVSSRQTRVYYLPTYLSRYVWLKSWWFSLTMRQFKHAGGPNPWPWKMSLARSCTSRLITRIFDTAESGSCRNSPRRNITGYRRSGEMRPQHEGGCAWQLVPRLPPVTVACMGFAWALHGLVLLVVGWLVRVDRMGCGAGYLVPHGALVIC